MLPFLPARKLIMCGICGIYQFDGLPEVTAATASVRNMTRAMARRGPDDEKIWYDAHCVFGFRRLAILDLSSAGNQPMLTPDGRFVLVMNGEIYNYLELKSRLEDQGVVFRSTGDAEVALYSLALWSDKALELFNGMFALAFYDTESCRLVLARDHVGIKPLYYGLDGGQVIFSSNYDQVCRLMRQRGKGSVLQEAVALYLRYGHVPSPFGIVQNTYAVEEGSAVIFEGGGAAKSRRYFDVADLQVLQSAGSPEIDSLEETLSRAIKRQLAADVPVGVFLSGGVDSPLVASFASQHYGDGLKAFTIGVEEPSMDERADATGLASQLRLEHHAKVFREDTLWNLLGEAATASSEPNADYSILPTMLVSKLAREHVTVALSGDGGDELFWGYASRFASSMKAAPFFRHHWPVRLVFFLCRYLFGLGSATREVLFRDFGRLYRKKQTIPPEDFIKQALPRLYPSRSDAKWFDCNTSEDQAIAQFVQKSEMKIHLQRILQKVDRASMHYSLEVRVPLLDKEVIAEAVKFRWKQCLDVHAPVGKLPLREVLRRRGLAVKLKKTGFTIPITTWLKGPLKDVLQEEVLSRRDLLGIPLDRAALRRLESEFKAGRPELGWAFWALLSLSMWERAHYET